MEVAFEQQPMQIVGQVPLRGQTEERIAEMLDALAKLAAEVDVACRRETVERDELDRRPEIVRPSGVLLVVRDVVVAQEMIRLGGSCST
jgi:hypothetical protein